MSSDGKMLAIADTGHHRVLVTDNTGIVQVNWTPLCRAILIQVF